MEIVLVKTESGFDTFNQKMLDRYGKDWDLKRPFTFPCLVIYEVIYNNCYPDEVLCYTIEKKDFDDPTNCDAIDTIVD